MESLKKSMIVSFSNMPSIEGMENNNLILVTAAGTICGTPVVSTEDFTDSSNILNKVAEDLACEYRNQNNIPEGTVLDGNDGFLTLKDVTIRNTNGNISVPFLCVFFDQIIGVSIGNIG